MQSEVESTSDLGAVDSASIAEEISSTTSKRKSKYEKWNPKNRYLIRKYASENGNAAAIRKFKPDYPNLTESTVRTFKTKYQEEITKAAKEKRDPGKEIEKSKAGRPLMLGELDSMVQTYLIAQSRNGCVKVNTHSGKLQAVWYGMVQFSEPYRTEINFHLKK